MKAIPSRITKRTGRTIRANDKQSPDNRKLEFLRRYGWLTDDDDVRAYSAKYKPKK